jgi:hypothetical protein
MKIQVDCLKTIRSNPDAYKKFTQRPIPYQEKFLDNAAATIEAMQKAQATRKLNVKEEETLRNMAAMGLDTAQPRQQLLSKKSGPDTTSPDYQDAVTDRTLLSLKLRKLGLTFKQIAPLLGTTASSLHSAPERMFDKIRSTWTPNRDVIPPVDPNNLGYDGYDRYEKIDELLKAYYLPKKQPHPLNEDLITPYFKPAKK